MYTLKEIFAKDKIKHYSLARNIGYPIIPIVYFAFYSVWLCLSISILISIAAAYKELIYDKKQGKGAPEFLDWLFSTIGALEPFIVYLILLTLNTL